MEIRILDQGDAADTTAGSIALEVSLGLDDVMLLKQQALRAIELERSIPENARSPFGCSDEAAYVSEFIKTRATNDALESYNIIPVATPRVCTSAGLVSAEPFTCRIDVHPRPHIGLTSLDPVDLETNRIAKPGFSLSKGREGSNEVEYLDDVKVLRMAMTERLDSELPESAMRALGEEYQDKFERELAARGNDPETFRATHQIDDEQYAIMLTRRALSDAHWNYALDAVFVGSGFTVTEEDLRQTLEDEYPGYADLLLELHELRNDLYLVVEKYRRAKALDWLLENAIR